MNEPPVPSDKLCAVPDREAMRDDQERKRRRREREAELEREMRFEWEDDMLRDQAAEQPDPEG